MTSSIPTQSAVEMNGKHRPEQDVLDAGASKKAKLGAGGKELPELYKYVFSPRPEDSRAGQER